MKKTFDDYLEMAVGPRKLKKKRAKVNKGKKTLSQEIKPWLKGIEKVVDQKLKRLAEDPDGKIFTNEFKGETLDTYTVRLNKDEVIIGGTTGGLSSNFDSYADIIEEYLEDRYLPQGWVKVIVEVLNGMELKINMFVPQED